MKLVSLKILPKHMHGWESDLLIFGKSITQLYGENGAGKTPIIQALTYCLGYPVKFRDDIYQNCKCAILSVDISGNPLTIERSIDEKNFYIKTLSGNETNEFSSEGEFSRFFFGLLNLRYNQLIGTKDQPVPPYISTFLPLIYSDQNLGYTDIYKPPGPNFIKDQYVEMVRMAIGSPPKNSFSQKRDAIILKKKISLLDEKIVQKQATIAEISKGITSETLTEIFEKISQTTSELENLSSQKRIQNDEINSIDLLISRKRSDLLKASSIIIDLNLRIGSSERIKNEIEAEIETLNLNEDSKRVFESFKEICATPGCGLFLGSAESYGKNLLYLRDQIKDIDKNKYFHEEQLQEASTAKKLLTAEVEYLLSIRKKSDSESSSHGAIAVASQLTRELIQLESKKVTKERVNELEEEYVSLLNEREEAYEDLDVIDRKSNSIGTALIRVKTKLLQYIPSWLDVISTHNVSREITISNELKIEFGSETIDRFNGSTRLRVVLAVKAAIFEIFMEEEKCKFRFFILDTPKQHDIQTEHFNNYITALKKLSKKTNSQIIFSSTEYHYAGDSDDKEWNPKYPGEEQLMYLKQVSTDPNDIN